MNHADKDEDVDTGPPSSEPAPNARNIAVSHHGKVTSHATPEAAEKAQDDHHRTAVARHHKSVGRVVNGGKK